MNLFKLNFLLLSLTILFVTSCNDDDEMTPEYTVPTTYNFENVSYQGQKDRISMLFEMKSYMKEASTVGQSVDATRLKAMYENSDQAGFSQTYTKQIKSKTQENVRDLFEDLMDAFAQASTSTVEGSNGQAGVVASKSSSKKYLLNENGADIAQLIEKGLMGACFYYQATAVYMGDERMNVDNEVVEPGKGTAMEHHWDEAFGYFGVPVDFPANLDGIRFWGSYSNSRNGVLTSNQKLMDAFLKGRAAISHDVLEDRDDAIAVARDIWEEIAAASALHYLNATLESFDDMALRAHFLSEAAGFLFALQFNPEKTMTNSEVNDMIASFGGSADLLNVNFYNTDKSEVEMARDALAEKFNWSSIKNDF